MQACAMSSTGNGLRATPGDLLQETKAVLATKTMHRANRDFNGTRDRTIVYTAKQLLELRARNKEAAKRGDEPRPIWEEKKKKFKDEFDRMQKELAVLRAILKESLREPRLNEIALRKGIKFTNPRKTFHLLHTSQRQMVAAVKAIAAGLSRGALFKIPKDSVPPNISVGVRPPTKAKKEAHAKKERQKEAFLRQQLELQHEVENNEKVIVPDDNSMMAEHVAIVPVPKINARVHATE